MSSVGAILKGTPAKINSDLLVGAGLVDSVNGVTGAVTLAAGTGISIPAAVGQTITVSKNPLFQVQHQADTLPNAPATYPGGLYPAEPIPPAAIPASTQFGTGFTPTETGWYAIEVALSKGVAAWTWAPGDYVTVMVVEDGNQYTTTYFSFTGQTLGVTGDRTIVQTQTQLMLLQANTPYSFVWWVSNPASALDIAGSELYATIYTT
jgi:hypothetical protein